MEINSKKVDQVLVISVSGRLDTTTAQEFESSCLELVKDESRIVVDLQEVEYVSSAGLRGILSVGKTVRSNGGGLVFCCLRGMVKEVFEISGFASIFSIYDTREQALESA
ncbi:anti-sigma-factor antagonist [Desulfonatronospira thiodismutans ASO3-1]|uniref:Anti-sigma factor antagonist n=1 Tax=Desulfonatronospira thiodismutans ASO3-1 TaxID=555779 RepID=D6SNU9_9BACT|nr:STAS domain-containing protein [Desulfonatronospira thiodismutans]EFI34425.1 anti-sigma-factor antagonist [Desulfonatronospira thiodismutans ASO3-1]